MKEKAIPLKAVRDALAFTILREKLGGRDVQGKPLSRFAAYTCYAPLTSVTCADAWRGGPRRQFPGLNLAPLDRGNMDRVLERVRVCRGLPEVRRTWGAGVRELRTEFADGVLR